MQIIDGIPYFDKPSKKHPLKRAKKSPHAWVRFADGRGVEVETFIAPATEASERSAEFIRLMMSEGLGCSVTIR